MVSIFPRSLVHPILYAIIAVEFGVRQGMVPRDAVPRVYDWSVSGIHNHGATSRQVSLFSLDRYNMMNADVMNADVTVVLKADRSQAWFVVAHVTKQLYFAEYFNVNQWSWKFFYHSFALMWL